MQFLRKPVVVDAFRFLVDLSPGWFMAHVATNAIIIQEDFCSVPTIEGIAWAESGDWIIRSVNGDLSIWENDLFGETYEVV